MVKNAIFGAFFPKISRARGRTPPLLILKPVCGFASLGSTVLAPNSRDSRDSRPPRTSPTHPEAGHSLRLGVSNVARSANVELCWCLVEFSPTLGLVHISIALTTTRFAPTPPPPVLLGRSARQAGACQTPCWGSMPTPWRMCCPRSKPTMGVSSPGGW